MVPVVVAVILACSCSKEDEEDGILDGGQTGSTGQGEQVTLDHVDGLYAVDSLRTGVAIRFHIRLNNTTPDTVAAFSHGFEVYSPNGARWGTTTADVTADLIQTLFDGGMFVRPINTSGSASDTIGVGGFRITGLGLVPGFDDVAFSVGIGPIDQVYHGRLVCLDSTFFPPGGTWLWATTGINTNYYPDWDGAHCFWIINPAAMSNKSLPPDVSR